MARLTPGVRPDNWCLVRRKLRIEPELDIVRVCAPYGRRILGSTVPGKRRDELSEKLAAPFLEGMDSPPKGPRDTPHWS